MFGNLMRHLLEDLLSYDGHWKTQRHGLGEVLLAVINKFPDIVIPTLQRLVTLISPGGTIHDVELLGSPRLLVWYDILNRFYARDHFDLRVGDRQSRGQSLHAEVIIMFGLLQTLFTIS
jgi:hypothetical protein